VSEFLSKKKTVLNSLSLRYHCSELLIYNDSSPVRLDTCLLFILWVESRLTCIRHSTDAFDVPRPSANKSVCKSKFKIENSSCGVQESYARLSCH
jgi:hypothetical protein